MIPCELSVRRRHFLAHALVALLCLGLPALAAAQDDSPLDCTKSKLSLKVPKRTEHIGGKDVSILEGGVMLECDDTQVFADRIEIAEDVIRLFGNVTLKQPDLSLYAERAVMNRKTKYGTFYIAHGTGVVRSTKEKSMFGGQEPDVMFDAEELEKIGPKTYRFKNANVTTCAQPTPRWLLHGGSGAITLDEHVLLKNAILRVKDVPLFYLPAMYYPIDHQGRSTGFLMPQIGSSTIGGFTISNAFFWAIDRSQDATFYYDWMKKGGKSYKTDYRYVSGPGSGGNMSLHVINESPTLTATGTTDTTTVEQPGSRQYTINAGVNQQLPHGYRLTGLIDYFTSARTNQLFEQNFTDTSQSTRNIRADLSGYGRRYRLTATFEQRDYYADLETFSRRGWGPRVVFQLTDRSVGRSKVYVGATTETAYVIAKDGADDPNLDHSLWRVDATPHVTATLSKLQWLDAQTSAAWRLTEWFESVDADGNQVPVKLIRQLLTFQTGVVGPKLVRVFRHPDGSALQHKIEPFFTFTWTSPFNDSAKIVPAVSDWQVGGTTQLDYGVNSVLYKKRRPPAGAPAGTGGATFEVLRVRLDQSYYTNAFAASVDPQNQTVGGFAPVSNFSPIRLSAIVTAATGVHVEFRTEIDPTFRTPRTFSASGSVNLRTVNVSAGWSKKQVIPHLNGFDNPLYADHFLNAATTIKRANGHAGGSYSFQYDVLRNFLAQQRIVAFYNSQCCGVSVDYGASDVSHLGIPNLKSNHHFGVSFTLAGIGSFSNPFGSFGR